VAMRNLCLVIAYDGTDFHGWQRQPRLPTVQSVLEASLARITGKSVKLYGSGRTDAGVHAAGQVANFETECPIPCKSLRTALNDALPPSIRVRSVREVGGDFHARYGARSKNYRYRILQSPVCPPFLSRFVYHYPYSLDCRPMSKAARALEGEHDFTSFAGADPGRSGSRDSKQEVSNVRQIFSSRLVRRKDLSLVVYEVRGSGFLHHMVRNIVGTLMEVGNGRRAPGDILSILEARDRSKAGPTAPAQGLWLVKVEY